MRTIKVKIFLILGFMLLINLSFGPYVMYRNASLNEIIHTEPSAAIIVIQEAIYLNKLAETIRYEDEVLTQSARNYAYTSDEKWRTRYNEESPKLDLAINEAVTKGDAIDKAIFESISDANAALLAMGSESMGLVDIGNRLSAQTILDSTNYSEQKSAYKLGLDKYYNRKTVNGGSIIESSFNDLNSINTRIINTTLLNSFLVGVLITTSIVFFVILYLLFYFLIIKPISVMQKAIYQVGMGDYSQQIQVKSNDEIGELSKSYNLMTSWLKQSTVDIEAKIEKRTKELERLNGFMVDRELKMIELKKQIKDLKASDANKK